jgi:hypothetical protein
MRLVDDGLAVDRAHLGADLVRVHCSEDLAGPLLGPAFALVHAKQPAARLEVTTDAPADEIVPRLLRGQLDLALVYDAHEDARVRIQLIGAIPHQVYCSAAHPLARVDSPTMDEILAHPFAVYPQAGTWAPEHERTIAVRTTSPALALDLVLRGQALAVLGQPLAVALGRPLRPLPVDVDLVRKLYALVRIPIRGTPSLAAQYVEALSAEVTRLRETRPAR